MTAMPDLATIAAELAEWLAARPLDDLPTVASVDILGPHRVLTEWGAVVKIQLSPAGGGLTTLADWAEHLNTTVVVTRHDDIVRAAITTSAPSGHRIALWTHLDFTAQYALTASGLPIASDTPVEITAGQLRAAITHD
ncbi:hypothetical protein AB0H34_43020 [Saccharopolyspora shandongensis]|uniref:hypothetical protein n=1 Tax=Saccharopolyspora shandongensis TaxID=418495 RepID=UPI0033C940B4